MTDHYASVNTEQRVLTAITLFIHQHGYSPTLEDLRTLAELSSKSLVLYHLRHLKARGLVQYEPGKTRTIRLVHCA
jgi:SOS-response transcriptional repressor LexA